MNDPLFFFNKKSRLISFKMQAAFPIK